MRRGAEAGDDEVEDADEEEEDGEGGEGGVEDGQGVR